MNQFKKTLMLTVLAGGMAFASTASWGQAELAGSIAMNAGVAAGGTALAHYVPYAGLALGLAGAVLSMLYPPPYQVVGVNVDPALTAAEYMVLNQMKKTNDEWKPKPQQQYQEAAKSNGAGSGGSSGGVSYDDLNQTVAFQVASLKNVGIEVLNVGPMLAEIATTDTYNKILSDLEWAQPKSGATTKSDKTGAGSCAADYSVCSKYDSMSPEEQDQVPVRQMQNQQNYGTAGIAHAELGLMSVQQAIANDGDSSVNKVGTSSSSEAVFIPGTTTTGQNLSGMIGSGANTVAAMKVVALMNLELAQRLNQGNMMQGSILTIEAARAFPDTATLTD